MKPGALAFAEAVVAVGIDKVVGANIGDPFSIGTPGGAAVGDRVGSGVVRGPVAGPANAPLLQLPSVRNQERYCSLILPGM